MDARSILSSVRPKMYGRPDNRKYALISTHASRARLQLRQHLLQVLLSATKSFAKTFISPCNPDGPRLRIIPSFRLIRLSDSPEH
jgi:hypothetical protein